MRIAWKRIAWLCLGIITACIVQEVWLPLGNGLLVAFSMMFGYAGGIYKSDQRSRI